MKELQKKIAIFGMEHNAVLCKKGDITVAYEVMLPEIFTMSDQEYEVLHQTLIKAIKIVSLRATYTLEVPIIFSSDALKVWQRGWPDEQPCDATPL